MLNKEYRIVEETGHGGDWMLPMTYYCLQKRTKHHFLFITYYTWEDVYEELDSGYRRRISYNDIRKVYEYIESLKNKEK